jgi:hypothetical protein
MRTLLAVIVVLGVAGCTPKMHLTFPGGMGPWDSGVQSLGPVVACGGGGCCGTDEGCQWPLALTNPPEAYTYQAALRSDAAKRYSVPSNEVVLSDIAVELDTELVGTVRGWKATATAGRKAVTASGTSEERLRELQGLLDKGLIDRGEYERKRAAILDSL